MAVTLEPAVAQRAPEYPGPTAGVPREVSGSCVYVLCESLDAVERALEASDTHTTPLPPLPGPAVHTRPSQTGSCWRQLSSTGSCGKPRFPQRRTAAGVVHTYRMQFQRRAPAPAAAATAAAHQIGPCHAAANESCGLGSTSKGGQPIAAGDFTLGYLHLVVRRGTNFASPSPESKSRKYDFKKTACLISTVVSRKIRQHRVSCGSQASRRRWYIPFAETNVAIRLPRRAALPFRVSSRRSSATSLHGIANLLPHRAFSFEGTTGL